MPQISQVPQDAMITAADKLLGTGVEPGSPTRNYTLGSLVAFFIREGYGAPTLRSGTGAPDGVVLAEVGDFYLDTATTILYGPKPEDTQTTGGDGQPTLNTDWTDAAFVLLQGHQGRFRVNAYTRSATEPDRPTDLIWTESTNALSGADAAIWSLLVPDGDDQLWEVEADFDPALGLLTIESWSSVFIAGAQGPAGAPGLQGPRGFSLSAVSTNNTEAGDTNTITITSTDPDVDPLVITVNPGAVGERGEQGFQGDGVTITNVDSGTGAGDITTITFQENDVDPTTGTVSQRIEPVVIQPGNQGEQGAQGPAGPAGADSTVPGPQGIQGPIGLQGPRGIDVTRVINTHAAVGGEDIDGEIAVAGDTIFEFVLSDNSITEQVLVRRGFSGNVGPAGMDGILTVPTVDIQRDESFTDTAQILAGQLQIRLSAHDGTAGNSPDPEFRGTRSLVFTGAQQNFILQLVDIHGLFTYVINSVTPTTANGFSAAGVGNTLNVSGTNIGSQEFTAVATPTHTSTSAPVGDVRVSVTVEITAAPPTVPTFRSGVLSGQSAVPTSSTSLSSITRSSDFVDGTMVSFIPGAADSYAIVIIPTSEINSTDFTDTTTRYEFTNRAGLAFIFDRDATDSFVQGSNTVLFFLITASERLTLINIQ